MMAAAGHGTLTIYTQVDDSGLKKGLKGITKSVNQITSLLSFTAGIAGMVALGRSAINAASDLQEYRNVAEVTFGKIRRIKQDCSRIIWYVRTHGNSGRIRIHGNG